MSAVDNKHLVEIVAINVQKGDSKKTGRPYEIHKAQCVVTGPDGAMSIGELNLSKELAVSTAPGKYLVEFELAVSYERMVIPRIIALHAHSGGRVSPGAAAPAKG